MTYPLANDENGCPLDVPANAVGWLVRRHGGQRGRPGAIYDGDGRPLVVELSATIRELRSQGCAAGAYRLEAVDASRRPLGVVAFTEVPDDGDLEHAPVKRAPEEPMQAMARMVEAMQRTQAERERWQAEMFMRLIDRISPPPPQPVQDLRNALSHVAEMQRAIRKIAGPEHAATPTGDATAAAAGTSNPIMERLAVKLVDNGLPILTHLVFKWMGLTPQQIAGLTGANAAAPTSGAGAGAPSVPSGAAPSAEAMAKLDAVFSLLTPEEDAAVRGAINQLPLATVEAALNKLVSVSPEQAVEYLRATFLRPGGGTA